MRFIQFTCWLVCLLNPLLLNCSDHLLAAERSTRMLIEALRSEDPRTRRQAADELAALGPRAASAAPALTKAIQDPHAGVRIAAIKALGRIGPQAIGAAPALIRAIDDRTRGDDLRPVWTFAAAAIGRMGPQMLPQLIDLLNSPHLQQRRAAAVGLHELGPDAEPAVESLVKHLEQNDPELRIPILYALQGIGPAAAPAMPELIKQLSSDDFHTQYRACRAIGSIGAPAAKSAVPHLQTLVQTGAPSVRGNAAAALGAIGPAAGPAVVSTLTQALNDITVPVQQRAATALGQLGPLAVDAEPALKSALADKKFGARTQAALSLWRITGQVEAALEVLVKELQSPNSPWEAAAAFGQMGSEAEPAVPQLVQLLDDESADTRLYTIDALAAIGPDAKPALQALRRRLQDENGDVRAAAGEAIEVIGGRRVGGEGSSER